MRLPPGDYFNGWLGMGDDKILGLHGDNFLRHGACLVLSSPLDMGGFWRSPVPPPPPPGQSVRIGMKLELDVWHHPLDVYAKLSFKLISHNMYKKGRKTFRWLRALVTPLSRVFVRQRSKNCPTMTKISKDQDTHNISMCTKSEASIWFLRPWMQINDFDLFLAVK